ncbi:peptidoglycan-binding protein [Lacimicrobium alkaliphilum]|uniref:Peptidoglycan-binding protein n=2 Tax=Lacimicrobium alkaliphilum TaxID=1526571 RepID=A0ABQ1RMW1_9ALTE|nr:peptidoglycan-binding protein [Lacimicrobium alkaliphilum]
MAVVIRPDAPEVYRVKKGDTLWDISAMYLTQPWLWPELWRTNSHITNPHLIFPGDELRLVINEDGEAELVLSRETTDKPQKKLSPEGRLVNKSNTPVPVLPWSVIAPFVKNAVVLTEEEFNALPKVLIDYDDTVRYATEDVVVGEKGIVSDEMLVLRQERSIYDMQDNKIGVQIRNLASATLIPTQNQQYSLLKLDKSRMETRTGDRLAPVSIMPEPEDIQLRSAENQRGHILGNLQEHDLMGRLDVIVIDLGQQHVAPGTVMGIYKRGPVVQGDSRDNVDKSWLPEIFDSEEGPQLPAIKTGELVVFKTFARTSYALILDSSDIVRRGDIIARP